MTNYNTPNRHKVYICYFDESGFKGLPHPKQQHANWFVLNCIMMRDNDWLNILGALVQLRQQLRDSYGIPVRAELKGREFRSGKGAFNGLALSRRTRMKIYKDIMNWQTTLPLCTFSVAIKKRDAISLGWSDPMYCAWNFALNRLNTKCSSDDDRCSIYPDGGHADFIQKCVRSMRRFNNVPKQYGPGTFTLRTERILEDPSNRDSKESYFIQLSDLNAYASHRSKYIDPVGKMNDSLWDELGTDYDDIRLLDVNKNTGGYPPSIKKYP